MDKPVTTSEPTGSRYTFHILPERIKGWFGERRAWYEIQKPNGIVVFGTSDENKARNTYQLLCEAFNEGVKSVGTK
jgi:hypothetical protein